MLRLVLASKSHFFHGTYRGVTALDLSYLEVWYIILGQSVYEGLFSQSVWVEIEQLSVSNGKIFLIMCFALAVLALHVAGHSYCMEVYTTRSLCYGFGQSESLLVVSPSALS